jgi:hypothetical protein
MERRMWSERRASLSPFVPTESLGTFMIRQLVSPWFWLLYLVMLCLYLLWGARSWLRNRIFWDIR